MPEAESKSESAAGLIQAQIKAIATDLSQIEFAELLPAGLAASFVNNYAFNFNRLNTK